ncbi:hypothetical protein Lal_00023493 [Lupinus albus]|nr:hypothetical protein Lal_00023493 [Lupinus albus]
MNTPGCGNGCSYCDCNHYSRCDADCGHCGVNYFVIKTIFLNPMRPDAVQYGPMWLRCCPMWLRYGPMRPNYCDLESNRNYSVMQLGRSPQPNIVAASDFMQEPFNLCRYHLECVGLTIDEARALVHFQCSDCTSTSEVRLLPLLYKCLLFDSYDELDAEAVRDNGVPPAIEDQVVSIEQDESSEESENTEGVQAGTGEIEPIYVEDVGEHVWDNFTGNRQGPIQVPRIGGPVASQESQNNDAKMTNLVSMKNKRKQPMGPTMMIRSMKNSANYDTEMAEISATKVMNVINNMEYCLKSGSTLWCKALYLLEDATRRELFLEMKDDASRMAWINFRSEIMDEEE